MKRKRDNQESHICGLKCVCILPHPAMNVAGAGLKQNYTVAAYDDIEIAKLYEYLYLQSIEEPDDEMKEGMQESSEIRVFNAIKYFPR